MELVKTDNNLIEQTALDYIKTFGGAKKLSDSEAVMFINVCKAFNLNPFKREIHVAAYGEGQYRQFSLIVGYEVYLKRAYESGQLKSWHVCTDGKMAEGTLSATITINRKDQDEPFSWTVYYNEYVQYTLKDGKKIVNKMWESKPYTMLKKVVIGQGFRLCFPSELAGMPYMEEEYNPAEQAKEKQDEEKQLEEMLMPKSLTPEEIEEVKKEEALTNVKI